MTAGGGWLTPASEPMPGLSPLGVRSWDVIQQVARCSGTCCDGVLLGVGLDLPGGLTPEELHESGQASKKGRGWVDRNGKPRFPFRDGDVIADMMVSVGVRPQPSGEPGNYFRCRHHCGASGDCQIYDRRPAMCALHGLRGMCDIPTCTMRVQVNPLVLRDPSVPPQVLPEEPVGWVKQLENEP